MQLQRLFRRFLFWLRTRQSQVCFMSDSWMKEQSYREGKWQP